MILPGAMLGILGGGQLGKMFAVAAQTLGYRVTVLDPDPECPAHSVCHRHIIAEYDDVGALDSLRSSCAAITTEFENVPAQSLRYLAQTTMVRPSADAVAIAQNRASEKQFLMDCGFATARFQVVNDPAALRIALDDIGFPAIVKTSIFGYDGKGQYRVYSIAEALDAFADAKNQSCVIEEWIPLKNEISVLLARNFNGETVTYPVAENIHSNGILDMTVAPARISDDLARQAVAIAERIAMELKYCGVLAVEFFVLQDDRLLVNEIAPRPHNSGHYTLDACVTSQFEQQVRALCDLPLGDPAPVHAAAMVNLLGNLWDPEPDWSRLLCARSTKLHLYGKREARPSRKMGHYTSLAADAGAAASEALAVRRLLCTSGAVASWKAKN